MKIPVLAYHSHRIEGDTYDKNDHIALYHDLRTIHTHGFHIVPISWIVEWVLDQREEASLNRAIALTFDDGPALDYYDIEYTPYGLQRSFFNILRDFQDESGSTAQPHLHASSFVIASPTVREELDVRCLQGKNWLTNEWWKAASDSGLLSIYNHSWDHNHPDASVVCQKDQIKGNFASIDTYAECQAEIQNAAESIHHVIAPHWPGIFAYPWGQSSGYLKNIYFPHYPKKHRTQAAFAANVGYMTAASSRWNLPRFVCGSPQFGWDSPDAFLRILKGVG